MNAIIGIVGGVLFIWLATRPFARKQIERIPAWLRQAIWSAMLAGFAVHDYATGHPCRAGMFCLLFGLDIEQYFGGRRLAECRRICDQWSRLYDDLNGHAQRQHAALVEAYAVMGPIADRIRAQSSGEKH